MYNSTITDQVYPTFRSSAASFLSNGRGKQEGERKKKKNQPPLFTSPSHFTSTISFAIYSLIPPIPTSSNILLLSLRGYDLPLFHRRHPRPNNSMLSSPTSTSPTPKILYYSNQCLIGITNNHSHPGSGTAPYSYAKSKRRTPLIYHTSRPLLLSML